MIVLAIFCLVFAQPGPVFRDMQPQVGDGKPVIDSADEAKTAPVQV